MRRKRFGAVCFSVSAALVVLLLCVPPAHGETASQTVPEQHVNDIFDIANEEYKSGNYDDAVKLYEGLLSGSSLEDADIHYNLGNAYFKLGKYGKAIASYRRALLISPREQDVQANLGIARNAVKDKLDSPRSTELLHEIFFFRYDLNLVETECIFLVAYGAAVMFGVISLFWKRRTIRWASASALVIALVFGASLVAHVHRRAVPSAAVVTANEANVHTGPGDTYLTAFSLHDGAEMGIRKKADDWYQIELSDGRRGWIEASSIEVI